MDQQLANWTLNLIEDASALAAAYDRLSTRVSRGTLLEVVAKLDAMIAAGESFPPGSGLEHTTPAAIRAAFLSAGGMLTAAGAHGWDRALVSILRVP